MAAGLASILDVLTRELSRLTPLLTVAAYIVVALALGWGLRWLFTRSRTSRPTSGRILAGKVLVAAAAATGLALGLSQVYAVDLVSVFTTLGILSIALGFGLQNTVANLAAGVSLSIDKPFDVGDRIQVGETWGDVVSIGLRSTRIVTTSGQHVIIPNAMLDTREVWNSTHGRVEWLRLEIPIGISYDSSIDLAEHLALQAARRNVHVLAFPPPAVRMRAFLDSEVRLELRCWIDHAQDKAIVTDQLLRAIKQSFEEGGVHFPFPQRTISYAKEIQPASPAPEHLKGGGSKLPTILVCTRGAASAQVISSTVVEFARRVDAALVILHVRPASQAHERLDGEAAVNRYMAAAEGAQCPARGRLEIGPLPAVLRKVAKDEGASLVLFGQRQGRMGTWLRSEIQAATKACPVPVLGMDATQLLRDEVIEHWRRRLHPDAETR